VKNTTFNAVGCTSDSLVAVNLDEATVGKKFSCSCGGGEDALSKTACTQMGQYLDPDGNPTGTTTRIDWTFVGQGSAANPGTIRLAESAGIRGNSFEYYVCRECN
jgi:hypothetical protein